MNKLGFYIENSTVAFMRDALRMVRPPAILFHAGDRGLLQEIRRDLSPNSFIVGRMFVDGGQQNAWLDDADPEARGRDYANQILNYDFGYATEKGANGRLLIDAWMALNECLPGPASFAGGQVSDEFRRRAPALDRFQVGFRNQLQTKGLEAVAFNFGAGNYTQPAHYIDWFPRTLAGYKYLGFHEYGWPSLKPGAGVSSAALLYRPCMEAIRARFGQSISGGIQAVITETGLARMYKYPNDAAGDVGWLYSGDTLSEDQYFAALQWYNDELNKDAYVLGACLFQVGHSGRWESFRHLGVDNQKQPILILTRVARNLSGEPIQPGQGGGAVSPVDPNPSGGDIVAPPPDSPAAAALRGRLAAARATLKAAFNQTAELPDQVAALQGALDGLTTQTAGADQLPAQATALAGRLDAGAARLAGLPATQSNVAALRARLEALQAQITALGNDARTAAALSAQSATLHASAAPLDAGAKAAVDLRHQAALLLARVATLEAALGSGPVLTVGQPPMQDVRGKLPQHATAHYATRGQGAIHRIVVHHTVTSGSVQPAVLAQAQVNQGKAGITYHFLMEGDGTIYWTQPLEALTDQTLAPAVNAEAVAVALAGDFSTVQPPDVQLAAAAKLIAWLLTTLHLTAGAIVGRSELEPVGSPGAQWLQGARYKDALLRSVNSILSLSS